MFICLGVFYWICVYVVHTCIYVYMYLCTCGTCMYICLSVLLYLCVVLQAGQLYSHVELACFDFFSHTGGKQNISYSTSITYVL